MPQTHPIPPRNRSRSRISVAAVALVAVLITLVGGFWAATASAASSPAKGSGAWGRAAHLIPGLGTMSIGLTPFTGDQGQDPTGGTVKAAPKQDGMRAIAPAAGYGQVSDYQQIPAGFYSITVRPVGAAASTPPLITGTLKATAGQAFTVAGVGTKTAPRVEALADDLTPPKAGQTRVRLLPAASTAKTVTVKADNGPTVAQDAAFGQPTGYAAVPSGSWTLQASADGAAKTATSTVKLAGGSVYTLLVLDSGSGLKVSPVVDASGLDVMPVGGAQTGGGGLARSSTPTPVAIAFGAALLLAGAVTLRRKARAGRVT
jgi:hypothetical protein